MRIMYDNLLKTATLTATNENVNYPIANVFHKWKRKVFKSSVATSVITAVLDTPTTISAVAFAYHNLLSGTVAFYDSSDSLLDTWTLDVSLDTQSQYGTVADVAKVVFSLASLTTISLGSLFVGDSIYSMKESTQDIPLASTDSVTSSSDSQVSGRGGSVTRSGTITIPLLSSDERKAIELAFVTCGMIQPFFLDLWDSSHAHFSPVYGVFNSDLTVTHEWDFDSISFNFKEVN